MRVPRQTPGRPRRRPAALAGDKGYSYPAIRAWLRRRGVRTVIPERADQERQRAHRPGRKSHFDRVAYRRRSAIECTVGALKEARAVATRYEKLAVHYLAVVKLSMIRMLVKRLERPRSHTDHGSTSRDAVVSRLMTRDPAGRPLAGEAAASVRTLI